jgi:hypothetical protein
MAKHTKADPFNLKGCETMKGAKRLSEQPTTKNNVPGAEVNTIGNRPSASRTVKGMPGKLK